MRVSISLQNSSQGQMNSMVGKPLVHWVVTRRKARIRFMEEVWLRRSDLQPHEAMV